LLKTSTRDWFCAISTVARIAKTEVNSTFCIVIEFMNMMHYFGIRRGHWRAMLFQNFIFQVNFTACVTALLISEIGLEGNPGLCSRDKK
jgi:hypothetical protein